MNLLAQLTEVTTTTGILIAVNGATVAALGAVYRDCRKERVKLWAHIRELEKQITARK